METAARLHAEDLADAALVLAPNGVHLNWSRDEIPRWWASCDGPPAVVEWSSQRAGTRRQTDVLEAALQHEGFVWLVANVEALAAPGGKLMAYLKRFVRRRRAIMVVDESHAVKNPRAKRTRAVLSLAEACPFRRCLTGTPVAQGPFDLWSQYHVLDPDILGRRFMPFKQRYGVFRRARYGDGPAFDELVEYRNLDDLERRIAPHTSSVRKADCMDLPPRAVSRRYFVLPPEHRRVYDAVRDELVARLDDGASITAAQALTNLLRLQQVSRGHVVDDDGRRRDIGAPYPSVEAVVGLMAGHAGKAVVWCRFVRDADLVAAALETVHGPGSVAACVGGTPPESRVVMRAAFNDQSSPVRFWVGTLATGGVGVDLGAADLMVFYSHGFNLVHRMQGLERNYGSSQTSERLEVVDLVAADTADERALAVIERKENLAARITGAELRRIISDA